MQRVFVVFFLVLMFFVDELFVNVYLVDDDYLVDQGGILSCCLVPEDDCDIDIIPPL